MERKSFKKLSIADHILPIGIGLAALHWILESLLHVFVFSDGTVIQQLLHPVSHEMWMRGLVIILIVFFAYYVQSIVSHLKRARDETKFAYTELNQIFNTAADGMCVIDKGFNVLRINNTLLTLLGINHEQAIGQKCHEIFPGPLCHTVHCPMAKILAGEDRIECDEEKERADSISIPCIVTATPFRKTTGELVGIVEDIKDISERKRSEEELARYRFHLEDLVKDRTNELIRTNERLQEEIIERKRTEKELRKTNKFLESIFTNIHLLIAYMDSSFRFIRVNRAYAEVTGYDPECLNGRNFFDLFPDRKKEEIFHEIIERGEPYFAFQKPFEFPENSRHGVSFWDWSLHPVREVDGRVEGLILCLINVTERKQAEEALKESEDKYSVLVERAKDGVFIVQEGNFSFANKAMAELMGCPVDEMIGMSLQDLVTPEYREEIRQRYTTCSGAERMSLIHEIRIKCKDGTLKDGEISVGIIQYHGKPAIIGILRDITERRRIERELQRTQKLESLGILAGGIAHDFNNLLTAIIGNLSLIQLNPRTDGDTIEVLKEVETATRQAKGLTQQLLTFAKGGSPVKKATSVSKLLSSIVRFALCGSNAKCELSLPDDLWRSELDEGQINQVMNNVIINAIQAMAGGGIIKVRAENMIVDRGNNLSLKEGKYVKITIKDQGIGIPKEHLQKIFDPYFTTKTKGSGLGLAITYSIVQKHNGLITVESEIGVGTSFSIFLPAFENETFEVMDVRDENTLMTSKGKVLFMDDQKIIRDMANQMLNRLGYEVGLSQDGAEAVEQYRQAQESGQPFDVVILDLTVPGGMGGQEAIDKLRELDPKVKVIVSSGYSNDPIMSNFKKYGLCGVVTKPYDIKDLSGKLHEVINGERVTMTN